MARTKNANAGKLKIGDNWNAITIIAYSQNNPLKAVAEFVENSIDAQAKHIRIIRGKLKGDHYLKIIDDGTGIDDFSYVATHIGDSIKRKLKKQAGSGDTGRIQGEFGIGLLSFWTVGDQLMLTSTGSEGITRRMKLVKNNPGYSITEVRELFEKGTGTELYITPLLSGIRYLSGEKIQNYLASELRDRIAKSGVEIRILDKSARKELLVEPRKFTGQLIHNLPQAKNPLGEIYCELYINDPSPKNKIGLYRHGTRVIDDITRLEAFNCYPWNSELLEGIIDASFLQLTPGTRDGIVLDDAYESFLASLVQISVKLEELAAEQKKAEEEKVSKNILKRISKALRDALLFLPTEEYGWLHIQERVKPKVLRVPSDTGVPQAGGQIDSEDEGDGEGEGNAETHSAENAVESIYMPDQDSGTADGPGKGNGRERDFFEFSGPLHSAVIMPASAVISTGKKKTFQVKARDRKRIVLEDGFRVAWEIKHGLGSLSAYEGEIVEYTAPDEPGVEELSAVVTQNDVRVHCTAVVTVTKELFSRGQDQDGGARGSRGLPGYTFNHCPGELWRSSYDSNRSIIVINSGHADFLYSSRTNSRKLKYIAKLYAKELVLVNFPEVDREQLLERMIELQLYTEENL